MGARLKKGRRTILVMVSNGNKKVMSDQDINKLALRSVLLQASFNYERMQSGGWTFAMLPRLEKIFEGDRDKLSRAMTDNLEFMNTHPVLVGFLMGLLISLYEKGESFETINGIRVGLFGPLAGIGDSIFWFTVLPIVAGITASLAMDGNILGPIIFFIVYLVIFLLRFPLTKFGYNLGIKALDFTSEQSMRISRSATILGMTVIGGLIASYVSIEIIAELSTEAGNVVNIQTELLDTIFPNLLPIAYTFLMYYLLKNKHISPTILITITFILSIILSALGIL